MTPTLDARADARCGHHGGGCAAHPARPLPNRGAAGGADPGRTDRRAAPVRHGAAGRRGHAVDPRRRRNGDRGVLRAAPGRRGARARGQPRPAPRRAGRHGAAAARGAGRSRAGLLSHSSTIRGLSAGPLPPIGRRWPRWAHRRTACGSCRPWRRLRRRRISCRRTGRVVLGHPFNPPHLIPLVEMCGGRDTAEDAVAAAMAFYAACGKHPIRLRREMRGHVANRLQAAQWQEAIHLVREGVASVADIDAAISHGPGHAGRCNEGRHRRGGRRHGGRLRPAGSRAGAGRGAGGLAAAEGGGRLAVTDRLAPPPRPGTGCRQAAGHRTTRPHREADA